MQQIIARAWIEALARILTKREVHIAGSLALVALVVEGVPAVGHRFLRVAHPLVPLGQGQVGFGPEGGRLQFIGDVQLLEAEVEHLSTGEIFRLSAYNFE